MKLNRVTGLHPVSAETTANAIMNKDPKENPFSENCKRASVRLLYQINDRDEINHNHNSVFYIVSSNFMKDICIMLLSLHPLDIL